MAASLCFLLATFALAHCSSPLTFEEARSSETFQQFRDWQARHGKTYVSPSEEMRRYQIFTDNIQKVNDRNTRRVGEHSATFDLTQFADLSADEFRTTVLMTSWRQNPANRTHHRHHHHDHHHQHHADSHHQHHKHMGRKHHHGNHHQHHLAAPASFDWSDESGVVTSVKNQGMAGTCWAFAGLANVESLWGRKSGSLSPDLSPEALNACDGYSDPYAGAVACGPLGATMPGFYLWVIAEGGLMTWEDYPYCSGDMDCAPCAPEGYSAEWCGGEWPISPCHERDSCHAHYDRSKFVDGLKVTDFVYFDSDEESLKDSLVETGPLVAGIDATDLQLYSGGILQPDLCDAESLNHAVLLVGYGNADGTDFWRAKNSWGTHWGEDGFFRIHRGSGACGINADTSSAVLG